ncbi:hypothetical protein [Sagittula sp. MA-2]|jgi:hypothetical protein|uniref:hypothetical protein n=1 Tax=Sagittula sp. MA-2 TaxID=3048007 RepID=UPI0024C3897E|nr:hypothetical protein [Sagittula sp. MA-2]WHZ33425.1 hypothetical protein QNI11_12250 [Sagittula sp. MA-2]
MIRDNDLVFAIDPPGAPLEAPKRKMGSGFDEFEMFAYMHQRRAANFDVDYGLLVLTIHGDTGIHRGIRRRQQWSMAFSKENALLLLQQMERALTLCGDGGQG